VLEVFAIVLVPMAIGMLVKAKAPIFAEKMDKPVKMISIFFLAADPFAEWPEPDSRLLPAPAIESRTEAGHLDWFGDRHSQRCARHLHGIERNQQPGHERATSTLQFADVFHGNGICPIGQAEK
jgi:hypothetical protein